MKTRKRRGPDRLIVGERLRLARELILSGTRQRDVARAIGVSRRTLQYAVTSGLLPRPPADLVQCNRCGSQIDVRHRHPRGGVCSDDCRRALNLDGKVLARERAALKAGRPFLGRGIKFERARAKAAERAIARAEAKAAKLLRAEANKQKRRARERARAAQRYAEHPSKKKASNNDYRRRQRLENPAYRIMERACVRRWNAAHPERLKSIRRNTRSARRARKRCAFIETVRRDRLYARAGGVCGICRLAIDPGESWHVDHIIPLSKGGEHSYANTQPAHARCNVEKGDRLIIDAAGTTDATRAPIGTPLTFQTCG